MEKTANSIHILGEIPINRKCHKIIALWNNFFLF